MSAKHGVKAFIRMPEVLRMTGRSAPAVYRDMRAGHFPQSVLIGPRARGWLRSEIEAWQAARIAARNTGADASERSLNPYFGQMHKKAA